MLSRDVFIVTNALWEAGAEAIAINGQRLTARSPIRLPGSDHRQLPPARAAPPDRRSVTPDTLLARFGAGLGAAYEILDQQLRNPARHLHPGDVTLPGAPVPATERAHRPTEGSS